MSNWDFGFTDPAAGHRGPRQPHDGGAGDAWEGTGAEPYPLTYERGRPEPGPAGPAGPAAPSYEPWPPAPFPDDQFADTQFTADEFAADEFAGGETRAARSGSGLFAEDSWLHAPAARQQQAGSEPSGWPGDRQDAPTRVWPGSPGETGEFGEFGGGFQGGPASGEQWPPGLDGDDRGNGRPGRRARRWVIPVVVAVVAAAAGVTTVMLTSGHHGATATGVPGRPVAPPSQFTASRPASQPAPSPPAVSTGQAPITMAQAKGVVTGYTTVNNSANAQRSDAQLATIETGSSFAIDAGLYQVQQAAGKPPFPAFGPVKTTYYIPRAEPAGGPRWFAVKVANAFTSNPGKVTSTEYLLFTQAAPGSPWRNAIEPYVLPGASTPRVAVGRDGLATAVSPASASLSVAPGQLAAQTAGSLDGTGQTGAAVTAPGDLADQSDQRFWQQKLPTATVTDTHTPATGTDGQEFALRTTGGGALVFYTEAAELTITPPPGTMLHLTVPGLYSPAKALPRAGLAYLDQFAAYDPHTGAGTPRVVAGYSGITGKN